MIRFQQVAKRFNKADILKGIDLEIQPGNRVALVGSNGAGKTTLIRCLLGEYNCDGQMSVDGLDARGQRQTVLKRVGFVPQLPPPLKMPVGQLISFSASVCDADSQRMEAVAHRLGLELAQLRHRPFVKLSGGQKQKILISVVLGRDSDILILDEPAANLDPEARHIFFQLLAEKPEHTVMLISSHRLDDACERCRMVLSDRHHAAQIRGGPAGEKAKVYKFDDIGGAIVWLQDKAWKDDAGTELWVNDHRDGRWIDGHKASYVSGQRTPMDFTIGAQDDPAEAGMTFQQARRYVLDIESRRQLKKVIKHIKKKE